MTPMLVRSPCGILVAADVLAGILYDDGPFGLDAFTREAKLESLIETFRRGEIISKLLSSTNILVVLGGSLW
jgi:hypothetical protein